MTQRRLAVVILILSVTAASPVFADLFRNRKTGEEFEGEVVRELGELVSIRVGGEIQTFPKSHIELLEKTHSPLDEYEARKQVLEALRGDVDREIQTHLQIAEWCYESGLVSESIYHFKQLLVLDPSHAKAREVLGYEKIGSDWYLKGSEEAAAAREGQRVTWSPLTEIPSQRIEPKKARLPAPKRSYSGAVDLKIREKVNGKKPEYSRATEGLAHFLGLVPESDPSKPLTRIEAEISVRFGRTHMFYGRTPVAHIYHYRYDVVGYSGDRKVFSVRGNGRFSASAQQPHSAYEDMSHYMAVDVIRHKLSVHPYFKRLGVKPLPDPEDG